MKRFYPRNRADKFFPGWKMTPEQHGKYWRMLTQCYQIMGATSTAEKEEARRLIHFRAFNRTGVSAKEIDHLKMFDAFISACLAILQPDETAPQLRQANMERIRFIYRINELAPEIYWRAEAKRKFGHDDLEMLSLRDLEMFRNHLSARASEIVWPETPGSATVPVASTPDYSPVNRLVSVSADVDENEPF